jgi:3-dehydroquinate synthase
MVETVHVPLGDRAYDIHIGQGLLGQAGAYLAPILARKRVAVISDDTVAPLHLETLRLGLATHDQGVAAIYAHGGMVAGSKG